MKGLAAITSGHGRFTVYPAIDVREGRVVRLAQGDYDRETRYDADPMERASTYAEAGAQWLHLVDLDAARAGGYTLSNFVRTLKHETTLCVQSGGGVRSEADVEALLNAGVDRVVVGSLAVADPPRVAGWLVRYGPQRITVALDVRQDEDGRWRPATHGWTKPSERTLDDVLSEHLAAGLCHLLCTDIDRDGMLSGPNLDLYAQLCDWAPGISIQASGGARDVGDVIAARKAGCGGIVLGKSLLEGRVQLDAALAC